MENQRMLAKVMTILLWGILIAAVLVPLPSPYYEIGFWSLIGLVCAHLVECLVFAPRVVKAEGSKPLHFLQLFIFGITHAQTLPK